MSIIEAKKKWGVAPAFNLEFVAYYEDREKRIKDLRKQVTQDKLDFEDLRNGESEVTVKFDKMNKLFFDSTKTNEKLRRKVELVRSLLGLGGADIPKAVPKVVLSKIASNASNKATSVNIKARSTAYSNSLSVSNTGYMQYHLIRTKYLTFLNLRTIFTEFEKEGP